MNAGLKMSLNLNAEAKLFFCCLCCFYDHHCWMEGAISAIHVLIPTAMPSSQPTKNGSLPAGPWDPRDGAPTGTKLMPSCFRSLRHQIWLTLTGKGKFTYFILHILSSCTKYSAFEKDGLFPRT